MLQRPSLLIPLLLRRQPDRFLNLLQLHLLVLLKLNSLRGPLRHLNITNSSSVLFLNSNNTILDLNLLLPTRTCARRRPTCSVVSRTTACLIKWI